MTVRNRIAAWLAVLALGLAIGCGARRPAPLRVFAPASLAQLAPRLASRFGDGPVTVHTDATSRLARALMEGAPADVIITADAEWMDTLGSGGFVDATSRFDWLTNRLVVVHARDRAGPADVRALSALERVGVAGAQVPAGRYARAALRALGVWDAIAPRVVESHDVRAALAWAATGDVDASIVYATDARVDPRVRVAFELPQSSHPPIVYVAARVTADGADAARGARFLTFLRGAEARTLCLEAGFGLAQ